MRTTWALLAGALLLGSCQSVIPSQAAGGFQVAQVDEVFQKVTGGGVADPGVTFGFRFDEGLPSDAARLLVQDRIRDLRARVQAVLAQDFSGDTLTVTGIAEVRRRIPRLRDYLTFELVVTDNGEPGSQGTDTFSFSIPAIGYSVSGPIESGNIQLKATLRRLR